MNRSAVNPTQWQVTGYYPEMEHDDRLMRKHSCLDRYIEHSRKIGTLVTNWFWNVLTACAAILSVAIVVGLVMLMWRYIQLIA